MTKQIESEKKDHPEVEQQIGNLKNIIQYENANILQSFLNVQQLKADPPNEYFPTKPPEKERAGEGDGPNVIKRRKDFVSQANMLLDGDARANQLGKPKPTNKPGPKKP